MPVKVVLVDVNPKMVAAWRATFEENPEVEVVQGSMLDQQVDAWVSPDQRARRAWTAGSTRSSRSTSAPAIETRVQQEIARRYGGLLPVGHATCVPTGAAQPRYLISTPTMTASSEDISDTLNVALACAAAFQAVHMQNAREPGSIRSVALPGLGANTGQGAGRDLRRPDVDRLQPVPRAGVRRLRRHAGGAGGAARRPRPDAAAQAEGEGQGGAGRRHAAGRARARRRRRPRRRRARTRTSTSTTSEPKRPIEGRRRMIPRPGAALQPERTRPRRGRLGRARRGPRRHVPDPARARPAGREARARAPSTGPTPRTSSPRGSRRSSTRCGPRGSCPPGWHALLEALDSRRPRRPRPRRAAARLAARARGGRAAARRPAAGGRRRPAPSSTRSGPIGDPRAIPRARRTPRASCSRAAARPSRPCGTSATTRGWPGAIERALERLPAPVRARSTRSTPNDRAPRRSRRSPRPSARSDAQDAGPGRSTRSTSSATPAGRRAVPAGAAASSTFDRPYLWRYVKSVFKRSMLRHDYATFGLLAHAIEAQARQTPGTTAAVKSGYDGAAAHDADLPPQDAGLPAPARLALPPQPGRATGPSSTPTPPPRRWSTTRPRTPRSPTACTARSPAATCCTASSGAAATGSSSTTAG